MISWLINLARRHAVTSCQGSGERTLSQRFLFVSISSLEGLDFERMIKDILDVLMLCFQNTRLLSLFMAVFGIFMKMPKSNVEYWKEKLYRNRERDARNQAELKAMGWTVLTVWECELKKDKREETLEILYDKITSQVNDE